ncbi:uncharacterized protein BDZ99DRAFT_482527 [Mytilinidion resinicola]|uniref:Uncharacterized protein n=1 Tax=Mytilinidion resinicola TaxID=574789 RepID=A0A6A6Y2U7_9PEZI|nr:uncharacterized protein BDZ99DRAFT_482527 [Mytilinidion resinicola]KAF2802990.1 hypothetical protein BDZ99DRAFT_482527 [Mytilinidion resinicola]
MWGEEVAEKEKEDVMKLEKEKRKQEEEARKADDEAKKLEKEEEEARKADEETKRKREEEANKTDEEGENEQVELTCCSHYQGVCVRQDEPGGIGKGECENSVIDKEHNIIPPHYTLSIGREDEKKIQVGWSVYLSLADVAYKDKPAVLTIEGHSSATPKPVGSPRYQKCSAVWDVPG